MLAQDDMVVRPVIAVISGIAVILWYWGRIAESRIEKPAQRFDSITDKHPVNPGCNQLGIFRY